MFLLRLGMEQGKGQGRELLQSDPSLLGGRESACRMGQQLRNHLTTTPGP